MLMAVCTMEEPVFVPSSVLFCKPCLFYSVKWYKIEITVCLINAACLFDSFRERRGAEENPSLLNGLPTMSVKCTVTYCNPCEAYRNYETGYCDCTSSKSVAIE